MSVKPKPSPKKFPQLAVVPSVPSRTIAEWQASKGMLPPYFPVVFPNKNMQIFFDIRTSYKIIRLFGDIFFFPYNFITMLCMNFGFHLLSALSDFSDVRINVRSEVSAGTSWPSGPPQDVEQSVEGMWTLCIL